LKGGNPVMNVVVQQRQRLFREGLGQLLQAQDDLAVVGIASTSLELTQVCQEHRPDVVVLEADAVEWDAGRVARNLRRAVPSMRIIGLSAGEMSRAEVARAHRDGIRDVLPRSAGIGRILAAVRATSALHRVKPQPDSASSGAPAESAETVLTPRELTILNLVGAGFTSREISAQLTISHKTVENHKQRVFGKLGVQNQAHAVSVAMRLGLIRPERVIGLALAD
jgi:DNA-binding NarL/FixJ family response regulator